MNIKLCLYIIFLVCIASPVQSKTLFYQPLLQDEEISQQQWDEQLLIAHTQGYDDIVFQWIKFGEVNFLKSEIIQRVFNSTHASKFSFWLGLYMPEQYYQCFESAKIEPECKHEHIIEQQISLSEDLETFTVQKNIKLSGWYIPTELTNKYLQHHEIQLMLESLSKWRLSIDRKLAMSYFFGYPNTLKKSKEDISYLINSGFHIFLQKGNGLLESKNIDTLIDEMPCDLHLVHEVFVETDSNVLKPLNTPIVHTSCHQLAVFSLRYLPFSRLNLIERD